MCVFLLVLCVLMRHHEREERVVREEEEEQRRCEVAAPTIGIRATRFEGRPWRAAVSMARGVSAADMEASAAVHGKSAAMQCDVVCATSSGGRGGEQVAEDLRGGAEAVAAQHDDREGAVARGMEMRRVGGGRCGAVLCHEAASGKTCV